MKKLFKLSVIILIIVSGYIYIPKIFSYASSWVNTSICEKPLTYTIGSIDSDFQLTEQELLSFVEEAGNFWEDAYGKTLFIYDPESNLEINLVYDERQHKLTTIGDFEGTVEQQINSLEEQQEIYEQKLDDIKQKSQQLNDEIAFWNSKGGAPKEEYDSIIKRQEDLTREAENINYMGSMLNQKIENVNANIDKLNYEIKDFNTVLGLKPEIGYYTSGENKIDVFFYSDEKYLVNVLAHEMGHALGLDHLDSEDSIMSPVITENTSLTNEDVNLVKDYCYSNNRLDMLKNDLNNLLYRLFVRVNLLLNRSKN
ncbi:matrixin family metalloprotease [Patescibacteria group bacterium]|nr:matrixin family metalloprotease [Patescibacteria group bacterium]